MSGRRVLRVLCNRPTGKRSAHIIGTVKTREDGRLFLTFDWAVRQVDGYTAAETTVELDNTDGKLAYCRDCRKVYPFSDLALLDAVRRGLKTVTLEPRGFLQDPIAVLVKRHGEPLRP